LQRRPPRPLPPRPRAVLPLPVGVRASGSETKLGPTGGCLRNGPHCHPGIPRSGISGTQVKGNARNFVTLGAGSRAVALAQYDIVIEGRRSRWAADTISQRGRSNGVRPGESDTAHYRVGSLTFSTLSNSTLSVPLPAFSTRRM